MAEKTKPQEETEKKKVTVKNAPKVTKKSASKSTKTKSDTVRGSGKDDVKKAETKAKPVEAEVVAIEGGFAADAKRVERPMNESENPFQNAEKSAGAGETDEGKCAKGFNENLQFTYINNTEPKAELIAALSYFLFFLPFIFCRDSRFAKFHANQGLLLLIFTVGLYLIFGFIPYVKLFMIPVIFVASVLYLFLGVANAVYGRAEPLPLIGKIVIIKW